MGEDNSAARLRASFLLFVLFLFFLLFLNRLLDRLHEMGGFLVGHPFGSLGLSVGFLGIIKGRDHLVRVVEDAPPHAHAHHFGGAGAFGLGLRLRLGFLLLW